MRYGRIKTAAWIATIVLGVATGSAEAQNLVTNPSFGTSLGGWTTEVAPNSPHANTWIAVDAGSSNRSGSGRIEPLGTTPSTDYARLVQCAPVTAGLKYRYGARVFVPAGQDGNGVVAIDLRMHAGANCTGDATSASTALRDGPATGTWIDLVSPAAINAPSGTVSALVMLTVNRNTGNTFAASFDDVWLVEGNGCRANERWLCLNENRFEIELQAKDPRTNATAQGVVTRQKGVFGYFSLPKLTADAGNPEVFIKALDGRPVNGRYWIFYSGLTDVELALSVREVATGKVKSYAKPGLTLSSVADTEAF